MAKRMTQTNVNWKIAGVGGFGLQAAASVFGRALLRAGYFVQTYAEYPSIIKGGPSTAQVRFSNGPVVSHSETVDLLVCLNQDAIQRHAGELVQGGTLVYDSTEVAGALEVRPDVRIIQVPMGQIVLEAGGEKIMRNAVSLGASLALLGLDTRSLAGVVRDQYLKRGEEIVKRNLALIEAGVQAVSGAGIPKTGSGHSLTGGDQRLLVSGNEAVGLGALRAGCQVYSGYPMTPSTSILKFLASHASQYNLVVRQEQDEISVINLAIGASHAGARAMVASSGGGFSLMVESYGLAAMTETPLVIVEVMRPGPATGLPTWTEQGDLQFLLHAAQGEFPRVVLAPGSVEECFQLTFLAFNLADRYQTPVIIASDKYLAESQWTVEPFAETKLVIDRGRIERRPAASYERYAFSADGVSPRVLPGTPGTWYIANSDEHDGRGLSNEEAASRVVQVDRRQRKLEGIRREVPAPVLHGPATADLTVVTWGSTTLPVREARAILAGQGLRVNALQLVTMSPFPSMAVEKLLQSAKRLVVVENNRTAQLRSLIREQTGITIDQAVLRYDGRQFNAATLAEQLTAYG